MEKCKVKGCVYYIETDNMPINCSMWVNLDQCCQAHMKVVNKSAYGSATVKGVIDRKRLLEEQVKQMIVDFVEQTDCWVEGVNLNYTWVEQHRPVKALQVDFNVRIK